MHFKSNYRKRLLRLHQILSKLLYLDSIPDGFFSTENLIPFLYQVFIPLWGHDLKDLTYDKKWKR